MTKRIKYGLFGLLTLPVALSAHTTVRASIDSAAIMIGQQTVIHLDVSQDKNKKVQFPSFSEGLMPGIEVLSASKPDTEEVDDRIIRIKQDLLVTSFDSGLYYIPAIKFVVGKDTLRTNSLGLKVVTLPVDTVKKEFKDIKGVMKPEWVLADYYFIGLAILIFLFFVVWGIYAYLRYKKDKPFLITKAPEPQLPPHIKAVSELENIKKEKLWQQGREKDYYTRLTDVLRVYLTDRFGINALEMTSAEILNIIRCFPESQTVYQNLKNILELADIVKFAKWHPVPDENEQSMINAILFIDSTKPVELSPEELAKSVKLKNSKES
ncbi:hypothetical protein [Parabacteroides sp. FAFU027]|uniref:hypothetical protein n=1 Tax=Parabacteroides sp. FAFU027 TaxID=2922715 RepID=UPI001FAF38A7|nr:hypothetical protein [Parabacteroides sp. FAFU027]